MQISMTNVLYKRGIIDMNQRDEMCRLILQSYESSSSHNEGNSNEKADPSADC